MEIIGGPRLSKMTSLNLLPWWLLDKESCCNAEMQEIRVLIPGLKDPWREEMLLLSILVENPVDEGLVG